MVRLVLLVAALVVPALAVAEPAAPPAAPPESDASRRALAQLLRATDADYARRDEPGVLEALQAKLEQAEREAPGEYEVLWRLSRLHFWLADDPSLDAREKSRRGKRAWDYGDRAAKADPGRVEGWNYAAAGMGNYALGIGVFKALRKGIEGKFRERLSRAHKIDPDFEHGAIQTAWGRFWYELPWPKYDAKKSRHALEDALRLNPDNVRARVYLADLLSKEGHPDEARAELQKAIANPPGRYDAPEERRWQAVARQKLASR